MSDCDPQRFECESCSHSSSTFNNLLRHYRENQSHKPEHLAVKQGRPKETAEDLISEYLHGELAPRTRSSRIKAFVAKLSEEELKKYCLHPVTKVVKPWEFVIESAKSARRLQVQHVQSQFMEMRDVLILKFPELTPAIFSSTKHDAENLSTECSEEIHIRDFLQRHKHLICQALIEGENEKTLFRETLMPAVYKKHADKFLKFASGLVGSLCVSQRDTQDILRNTWGKELASVLGINIFPPKDTIISCLNARKE